MRKSSKTYIYIIVGIIVAVCAIAIYMTRESAVHEDLPRDLYNGRINDEIIHGNNEPTLQSGQSATRPSGPRAPIPRIQTLHRTGELLAEFESYHAFDYITVYTAAHGLPADHFDWMRERAYGWDFAEDGVWGLVIITDEPLHRFQIIGIDINDWEDGRETRPARVYYELDVLLPERPLLIGSFITVGGVIPSEGISFIDSEGVRRYFFIQDDRTGYAETPYFLVEFDPMEGYDD